jgi:hypothetical protein
MIVRRRRTRNFTILENEVVEDQRLALDELGLLTWLRSRPDHWEVSRFAIGKRFGIGKEKISRIFRSLIECGWIVREMTLPGEPARYTVNDEPGVEIEMTSDQLAEIGDRESPKGVVADLSQAAQSPTGDSTSGDQPSENPPSLSRTESKQELTSPTPPERGGLREIPDEEAVKQARESFERFRQARGAYPIEDEPECWAVWLKLTPDEREIRIRAIAEWARQKTGRLKTSTPLKALRFLGDGKLRNGKPNEGKWQGYWKAAEARGTTATGQTEYRLHSREANAWEALHRIAGAVKPFSCSLAMGGQGYALARPLTAQMLALAELPQPNLWGEYDAGSTPHGAWHRFLMEAIGKPLRINGTIVRLPYPFPPSVDGKLYTAETATGPPLEPRMTEEDEREFTRGIDG